MSSQDTTEYAIPSTYFVLFLFVSVFHYISYTQLIAEIGAINFVVFFYFLSTFMTNFHKYQD